MALLLGQIVWLFRQRAAESDVQLLEAATDEQSGDAPRQRPRDQAQRDLVAEFVERAVTLLVDRLSIAGRMDVGLSAADEEAVEPVQIGVDVSLRRRGQNPRHGAGDEADRIDADHRNGGELFAARDHGIGENADLRCAAAPLPLPARGATPPLLKAVRHGIRCAAELMNRRLELSDVCP
ncbi:hypothetical protein ABIA09_006980 [Bradyrhizobium yuanmingense]